MVNQLSYYKSMCALHKIFSKKIIQIKEMRSNFILILYTKKHYFH